MQPTKVSAGNSPATTLFDRPIRDHLPLSDLRLRKEWHEIVGKREEAQAKRQLITSAATKGIATTGHWRLCPAPKPARKSTKKVEQHWLHYRSTPTLTIPCRGGRKSAYHPSKALFTPQNQSRLPTTGTSDHPITHNRSSPAFYYKHN